MTSWSVHHGDAFEWLASLPANDVEHVIVDPPYDKHVHAKVRSGRKLPDANDQACRARRSIDLGFDALSHEQIEALAEQYARVSSRWIIVFSNVELSHVWRDALVRQGLNYVRTGAWVKLRATPQFTGDRPAAGFEAITICHPKGRKRWNGGGKQGVWTYPVVANCNGHRHDRVHTTQKPIGLMMDLVRDFTDPGERILDSHMGSGTTGIAALRLGRRFVGCEIQEQYVEAARDGLMAESEQLDREAYRRGQLGLFKATGT